MKDSVNYVMVAVTIILSTVVASVEARSLYVCASDKASDQKSGGWLEKEFVIAVAQDKKSVKFFSRRLLEKDGLVEFTFPGKFEKSLFGGYNKRYSRFLSSRGPIVGGISASASFATDFSRYNFTINFGGSDGYYPFEGFGACSAYDGPEPEDLLKRLNASRMGGSERSDRKNSNKNGGRYRLTTKNVMSNGNLTCEYVNNAGRTLTYRDVSSCADFIDQ